MPISSLNSHESATFEAKTLYIMKNPPARLKHVLSYRTFDWNAEPRVIVTFTSPITAQEATFEVKTSDGKGYRHTVSLRTGLNAVTIPVAPEDLTKLNSLLKITVDSHSYFVELPAPVENQELSGFVLDISGAPVPGAWVVVLDQLLFEIAITDINGAYKLELPMGSYDSIAAFDSRYPKERLEDYYWNFHHHIQQTLDFTIGTAEVFRLTASAMRQNKIITGTFITWTASSLKHFIETEKPTDMNHPGFLSKDYTPELSDSSVEILLNGCSLNGAILLERTDILAPQDTIMRQVGYKFEVWYGPKCTIRPENNELEIRVTTPSGEIGRGRIGSLNIL